MIDSSGPELKGSLLMINTIILGHALNESCSLIFSLKTKITIIKELSKLNTISDINIDNKRTGMGINGTRNIPIFEGINKPNKKNSTTTTETNSANFINTPIPIENTPNKIRQEIIGNKSGKFNNLAFSGDNTKRYKLISQINRPKDNPSIIITYRGCRRNSISNKLQQFNIKRNKIYKSIIPNASISSKESKQISQIGSPVIEKIKINRMNSSIFFTPARKRTKTNGIISKLPGGSINKLPAGGTINHFTSPSIGSGQFSPINIHTNIIYQKCGAVKYNLGLENSFKIGKSIICKK